MKRAAIILFLALSFISSAIAQFKPGGTSNEAWSQLWNTSNVYYNTPTSSNWGQQIDTGTNTTVLKLYSARMNKGIANADTFVPAPISGYGTITIVASFLMCTNTPTVTVTPVASLDGIKWITVPGVTTVNVAPTSLTVSVNTGFVFPIGSTFGGKAFLYYGLSLAGSATSTYSVQAWWYFVKPPDPGKLR